MTELDPETQEQIIQDELLRESVRQNEARNRRNGVLLYLIPALLLIAYLLWGFIDNLTIPNT